MQSHLGFNMNAETFSKLAAPATAKIRQLQKIVQDIKKNDSSLLNRLKRLKSKPCPNVPARDYLDDNRESDDQLSDPDYDNDTYECPHEEDNYEPPPSQRVFASNNSGSFPRAEYIDSCRSRPSRPPKKPLRPGKQSKQLPPEPTLEGSDEDYIDPDVHTDDDNYVEPAENPPPSHLPHGIRRTGRELPMLPPDVVERQPSPECYEVPDSKENSFTPSANRLCVLPPIKTHPLPPKPSPRINMRSHSPIQEPTCDDEYEVCDPDDAPSNKPAEGPPPPRFPKPVPRERSPKPPVGPRPELKPKAFDSRTLPMGQTLPKPPSKSFTLDLKRPKAPLPQTASPKPPERGSVATENASTDQDNDADIFRKPWFANTCDRRTADDALCRSNKDGAFMVRKSSGHDAQQPYTLVVFYNSRVYNIPIRFIPGTQQYALGREKIGEEFFSSVTNIIESHQRNPLVLIDSQSNAKDATTLCYPVKP
ncbi:unnamed protein product [Ophioblennius macclurei]